MKTLNKIKEAVVQKCTDLYSKYFNTWFEQFYADVDSKYYNIEVVTNELIEENEKKLKRWAVIKNMEYEVSCGLEKSEDIYRRNGYEIIE